MPSTRTPTPRPMQHENYTETKRLAIVWTARTFYAELLLLALLPQ